MACISSSIIKKKLHRFILEVFTEGHVSIGSKYIRGLGLFSVYFLVGWRGDARGCGAGGEACGRGAYRQMRRAAPSLGVYRATRQVRGARTAAAARPQSAVTRRRDNTLLRLLYATSRDARVSNVVNNSRPVRRIP
ncbi:unnamed protein product [Arctia plantaginis]|uniref:Uncharacterized protein n=1 Tax=Arctia plantaginis TaxID=874455 RepID=A0A8S0ZL14_ARCPL|nr:unnamed protein product [Arctia plantaginis]